MIHSSTVISGVVKHNRVNVILTVELWLQCTILYLKTLSFKIHYSVNNAFVFWLKANTHSINTVSGLFFQTEVAAWWTSCNLEITIFGAVLAIPTPASCTDCCCGVNPMAQRGVNDIAWTGGQSLSSFSYQLCLWAVWIQSCDGRRRWWGRQYQQLQGGAMTHFHSALILWCMRAGPGMAYVSFNCMAISMHFQVWRWETLPKGFGYESILLVHLKKSVLFLIVLYCIHGKSLRLSLRHKENLKDKSRR